MHQQPADLGRALPALQLGERARLDELADRHDQAGALGERDELGGRDVLGVGAVPARERLGADDAARRQLHDRLVGDLEAALLDGALELAGERVAAQQRGGLAVVEDLEVPLLLLLGGVHGDVGVAQHLGGARLAVLAERDAGAGADPQRGGGELERLVERELDALGDAGGALVVAAVEQDRELVAAEARRQVAGAQAGAQAAGEGDQQLVADLVPEAVVDALEVVEVEEQHDRAAVGAAERRLDLLGEQRAVGEAGERVVVGAVREPVAVLGQLPERLLEPVVLERDRGVVGQRLQQREVGGGELGDAALAVGQRDRAEQRLLAAQRGQQQLAALGGAHPRGEDLVGRRLGAQQARAVELDRAAQRAGHAGSRPAP